MPSLAASEPRVGVDEGQDTLWRDLRRDFELPDDPQDDILTSTHGHYSSDVGLEMAARRHGAQLRRVPLYRDSASAGAEEMVESLRRAVRPSTRVVAVPWVDSGTGVKLPIRQMSALVRELNQERRESERLCLIVDAVHAFGVEDFTVAELGCDILVADTPMGVDLSSGINCFEVDGLGGREVVRRLRERGVVASITPYRTILARLSPCIVNSEDEVRRTIEAVASLRS